MVLVSHYSVKLVIMFWLCLSYNSFIYLFIYLFIYSFVCSFICFFDFFCFESLCVSLDFFFFFFFFFWGGLFVLCVYFVVFKIELKNKQKTTTTATRIRF